MGFLLFTPAPKLTMGGNCRTQTYTMHSIDQYHPFKLAKSMASSLFKQTSF